MVRVTALDIQVSLRNLTAMLEDSMTSLVKMLYRGSLGQLGPSGQRNKSLTLVLLLLLDHFDDRRSRQPLGQMNETPPFSALVAELVDSEDAVRRLGYSVDPILKDVN